MTSMNKANAHSQVRDRALSRRNAIGIGGAFAATALAWPGVSSAQQATPLAGADLSAGIDAVVADIMERTGIPGVAIGVVHNDQVVHLAGYGVREVGKPEPIDPDTVFHLASVSKGLAATTVAAMVSDGFVSWDDVVHELDPAFELDDPWITHHATVRDLFSHRSGLPSHAGDLHEDLGFSRAETIHRLRYFNPAGEFRVHYDYTNFGLSAAAFAAASAAGDEFENIARERLYDRLGMTHTSSRFSDYIAEENRAIPHMKNAEGQFAFQQQRQPDAQTPAGGVSSTARDMTHYLRMLLGNGVFEGETIIDPVALGETFRPHSAPNPADNPQLQRTGFYGLGWNVGSDEQGQMRFNHSGAFGLGAATYIGIVPAEHFGVIVLTNGQPMGAPETIGLSVTDLALVGAVAVDYLPFLEAVFAEELRLPYDRDLDFSVVPDGFTESLELARYAGEYENDLWGLAAVSEENGALVLQLGPDRTPYPLTHYSGDQFRFDPPGENAGLPSLVTFTIGADGSADRVTIDYLNQTDQGTLHRISESA